MTCRQTPERYADMSLFSRAIVSVLATASLSACAASQSATTYKGGPLAQAGHPVGFKHTPASKVASGSCSVDISAPELVAFGCPDEKGTFIEYKPVQKDKACTSFVKWANSFEAAATCDVTAEGALNGSTTFELDGATLVASLKGDRLYVTHVKG